MQSANMIKTTTKNIQRDIVAQCRADSILDRRIPLGARPLQARPIIGPTAQEYFRAKHAAGKSAKFYFHHLAAPLAPECNGVSRMGVGDGD
jgi:hypothetical protein